MYPNYFLEKLGLTSNDLDNLSETEQIQKIRLRWISLCLQAQDESQANEYTRYYHYLLPYSNRHAIHTYYERQSFTVHHYDLDITQREQINQAYQVLLKEWDLLLTEEDKQQFAQQHAAFLSLVSTLKENQSEFDEFFGFYLYLQQKKTLQLRIIQNWRLQMIRLFGIEGLDDFQYRHALITGELGPILANDKLYSPVKLLVAGINSLILVITLSFDFFLSYHILLRIGFFFFLSHPLAILMMQLSKIAKVLEMLACPTNQIIRPICTYTNLPPLSVSLLLSATALAIGYAALYSSFLANLTVLLPYIALTLFGFFLYSTTKLCLEYFKKSFADGIHLTATLIMLFTIQACIGLVINSGQTLTPSAGQAPSNAQKWLKMGSLFSLVTLLTGGAQSMALSVDMLPIPFPNAPIPETIRDTMQPKCNIANLSHRFFNTPKDAPARSLAAVENERATWGCLRAI